jgi:glucose uptake protein GlcU
MKSSAKKQILGMTAKKSSTALVVALAFFFLLRNLGHLTRFSISLCGEPFPSETVYFIFAAFVIVGR